MNSSADQEFSTQKISPDLISEIVHALKDKHYGSVEIFIENYQVVQITQRSIKKVGRKMERKFIPKDKRAYRQANPEA